LKSLLSPVRRLTRKSGLNPINLTVKVSTTKIEVTPEVILGILAGLNEAVGLLGSQLDDLATRLERLEPKPERRWEPNDGE